MGDGLKTLADIMTPRLIQVPAEAPVLQALEVMRSRRISSVLVTEGDEPDGILTERDVVRCLHRRVDLGDLICRDLRHSPLISLKNGVSYLEAYHEMAARGIRHLAVADDTGHIIGIVTEADLLRSLGVEYFTSFRDVSGVMEREQCGLAPEATVAEAVALMAERGISCVVVVDADGKPAGILTERDIVRLSVDGHPPLDATLREVATRPVKTVGAGALLHEAVAVMECARIRRMVVVDEDGRVCGMLSQHGVVQGLESHYVGFLKHVIQRQGDEDLDQGPRIDERTLLDNVLCSVEGIAVVVSDLAGTVIFGNPNTEAVLGLDAAGLHGQKLWAVLQGLGIEIHQRSLEALHIQGEMHFEVEHQSADGRVHQVDAKLRLLIGIGSKPQGYMVMARDVSDRHQVKQVLLAEQDLSAAVIDALPGLFFLADPDGRLVRWNVAWDAIATDGKAAPAKGDSLYDWFGGHDSDFAVKAREALSQGKAEFELPLRTGGATRHFLYELRRVVIGLTTYLIGTATDISDRKAAEDDLRRLVDHLHAANAHLERFTEVAAHDLQEPLRGIVTLSGMLSQQLAGKLDSDTEQTMGFIVAAAKRMRDLVRDLQVYSHVSRRPGEFSPVALNDVVNSAVGSFGPLLEEAGVELHVGDLPVVWADAIDMVQVIRNLIDNAIKFRRSGVTPRVEISARPLGPDWQISVADNGIGFDPRYAERIFILFKRLHSSSAYPGTGIGLTICQRIMERHGGRIWCESQPGQGSTFHFSLLGTARTR
jgi:PAS domain S-box-containing protein